VAVVLTLVQTKQIRKHIHKRNNPKTVQTIQNTVNTSTHITKTPMQLSKHTNITKPTNTHNHTLQKPYIHTPTRCKTHTYTHPHVTKQLKQPQYKIKS